MKSIEKNQNLKLEMFSKLNLSIIPIGAILVLIILSLRQRSKISTSIESVNFGHKEEYNYQII